MGGGRSRLRRLLGLAGGGRSEGALLRWALGGARSRRPGGPELTYSRAFLWSGGHLTYLRPLPGDNRAAAFAINDRGVVAGASWRAVGALDEDQREHAVIWDHGKVRDLGVPRGALGTRAVELNDQGQVVGSLSTDKGVFDPSGALLWDGARTVRLGRDTAEATAINQNGEIVGTTDDHGGFLWNDGTRTLFDPGPHSDVDSLDLNDSGEVAVLVNSVSIDTRAFLWKDGKRQEIRLPHLFLGSDIWLNNAGQVLLNGVSTWILWWQWHKIATGPADATALNERAQVAFVDDDETADVSQDGKATQLPVLGKDQAAIALALNDGGQIVGLSGSLDLSNENDEEWYCRAVLWTWVSS